MTVLATLAITSTAVAVDTGTTPPGTAPAPVPTPVPTPAPTLVPVTPAVPPTMQTTTVLRTLRLGSRGEDVRELQRVMWRRGLRIAVDGAYGPQTRRAVIRIQRKLRIRVSGVATPAFQRRLLIFTRTIRSGTSVPPPVDPLSYPLTGPNAARAKYLKAFPVAGKHTYFDDFGAPRSQGSHQGNDIMADRVPVRAVADGTIKRLTRVETGLGGIWIWLLDTAGNEYYYAHLTSIADGLDAGSGVTVGQVIGVVGNTGDARYGATHLHFELHPGGGAAISPYADLLAVDPEPPKR